MSRLEAASAAQQRIWLSHMLNEGDSSHTVSNALCFSGPLDVGRLRAAVRAVVRRHEALRTTYRLEGARLVQRIEDDADVLQPDVDLRAIPRVERAAAAAAVATADARRRFDLERGPVMRATLVSVGPLEHRLLLTVHHIAIDRWSRHVLVRELAHLYGALAADRPAPLPEPLQYATYAARERRAASTPGYAESLEHWKRRLAQASPVRLSPRPRGAGSRPAGYRSFVLAAGALAPLRALAREARVTFFVAMLAVIDVLLFRLTAAEDIVVAVPHANRGKPGTETLVGCVVEMQLLRVDLSGDPSFREVLRRARDVVLDAHRHGGVPFDALLQELGLANDAGRPPLCNVVLAFANDPDPVPELAGLAVRVEESLADTAKFDLTLSFIDRGDAIDGCIEYDAGLFTGAQLDALVSHLAALAAGAALLPDRPVLDLPLTVTEEGA
ncbi:condensation domain-containing protein [Sorangium sp. So ce362]|uniref:condensation domain-containing protein n=1 Tax=Sorangium sp. So ce362 TaxID=3133303 RepID=UPI003F60D872